MPENDMAQKALIAAKAAHGTASELRVELKSHADMSALSFAHLNERMDGFSHSLDEVKQTTRDHNNLLMQLNANQAATTANVERLISLVELREKSEVRVETAEKLARVEDSVDKKKISRRWRLRLGVAMLGGLATLFTYALTSC